LDEYQNKPLSDAFLTKLNRQFQLARSAGVKLGLRFSYNFITTGTAQVPDAKLDLAIARIRQRKTLPYANADVIPVLQAEEISLKVTGEISKIIPLGCMKYYLIYPIQCPS
jgi:Domain of unknown function (DUF4874)